MIRRMKYQLYGRELMETRHKAFQEEDLNSLPDKDKMKVKMVLVAIREAITRNIEAKDIHRIIYWEIIDEENHSMEFIETQYVNPKLNLKRQ